MVARDFKFLDPETQPPFFFFSARRADEGGANRALGLRIPVIPVPV
jgi:hypothetical protein